MSAEWLQSIGVTPAQEVLKTLEDEKVDLETLKGLSDDHLKELGFKIGERSKISKAGQPASGISLSSLFSPLASLLSPLAFSPLLSSPLLHWKSIGVELGWNAL